MSTSFVQLASASPRRRELLEQIGVPFRVVVAAVDEAWVAGETPQAYVVRLARAKAAAGRLAAGGGTVLAADTAVVLAGRIYGKPVDRDDALSMLADLSGRTHVVLTAVAIETAAGTTQALSHSEVTFREIGAGEARRYWETGEPRDKAGSYAVQGRGAVFIAALRGSYSGVMGLPLFETAALLQAAGVPLWQAPQAR